MGTAQSLNQTAMRYGVQEFNPENWQASESVLKRTSSTAKLHVVSEECKPTATYSSPTHAFLIDEYLLQPEDVPSIEDYLKEIQWRNLSQYLVNVRYIKGFNHSSLCESVSSQNFLYIQHIPLRLSQITDIPFPDNLYLLKACLKGFHYIFLHTHSVEIKEDHVCLNQIGRVKIWMNANLSKNTPTISNVFKASKKSQLMLVRDIINMVDENTDHQYEPINFKEHLREHNLENLTFVEAIEAVEQFASAFQIGIPSGLLSVGDLFDPLLNSHWNTLRNKYFAVNKSYSAGRAAQTNETKMLESVPLEHEQSIVVQQMKNSQNQFTTNFDKYFNQKQSLNQMYSLPFHTFQRPLKVNFTAKDQSYQETIPHYAPDHRQKQIQVQSPQKDMKRLQSQENWKYFDLNGWLDIDPEILQDLKRINQGS